MKSLPLFHDVAGKPVIVLGEGEAAEAKRRLVERAGAYVVDDDDREAQLAFIALDNPNLAAVRLKARGVLVNVVDRPDLCDFTVPSILDRDPVLVAVGTGGASAGLAKQLRLRLEALLPADLGKLASTLSSLREAMRSRWPSAEERRRKLDAALTQGGQLDPLADGSADLVQTWLANPGHWVAETSYHLEVASDDPDDLTLRQARLLGMADCIVHDPDIPAEILNRARADAVRVAAPHSGPLPEGIVVYLTRTKA